MVTDTMVDEDVLNLARVLRERDDGFIEIVQQAGAFAGHPEKDLAFIEKLAEVSRRPVLYKRRFCRPECNRQRHSLADAGLAGFLQ